MRISDWSSDVCSSDLQILCCKCPIKLVCFFKRSRQVAARNRRDSLEHAPGGFLRFSAGRSREAECQGQMRNDSNELSGARSEEQTSELQSLMRLTYAVFCLKKQKRDTHIANPHHHIKHV